MYHNTMEITRSNFADQLERITCDIKQACFIGFDAEFTALLHGYNHRLFDTNEKRYDNIKNDINKMVMTQVGLTMFRFERELDTYVATGYTFHLCPQEFGDIDQSFMFQASTLAFLCKHKFNFNKFIYEGLPYLSQAEEIHIQKLLNDKSLFSNVSRNLSMEQENFLQQSYSKISKWLINSEDETIYLDIEDPILRFMAHNEIRLRFPDLLTTDSLGESRKVLIYRNKDVDGANNAPMEKLEGKLMNHLLGFSLIIKLLVTSQKPIVGHNIFIDTLLLHNQFIGPLPDKYSEYKKNINKFFPTVFDTKLISYEMGKKLTMDQVWKSNALQDLYEFFSEAKCKKLEQGVNLIKLSTPFDDLQSYHEAGWDSFCSGYCFVRLGHWAAVERTGKPRPFTPTQKLAALQPYCNKINVIRGAVPYMNLVEDDPQSHRPNLLHVKTLKERLINIGKVASALAGLGSVDVKPFGSRTALVAASTQHTVDKILLRFRDSKEYKISKYNVYRHSAAGRMVMWSGALITGSLVLLLLHRKIHSH